MHQNSTVKRTGRKKIYSIQFSKLLEDMRRPVQLLLPLIHSQNLRTEDLKKQIEKTTKTDFGLVIFSL
jgi:hypothetical protein